MQLINVRKGLKPLTIAAGLLISNPSLMYADLDQYSNITSVISNQRTSKYIQEVDNKEDLMFTMKRKFYDYFYSWKDQTCFYSSVQDIVEQDDFRAIVEMGHNAVPFILDEITREPSNLVWALNFIYKKKITDRPNITMSEACKLWVKTLRN